MVAFKDERDGGEAVEEAEVEVSKARDGSESRRTHKRKMIPQANEIQSEKNKTTGSWMRSLTALVHESLRTCL